jgi:hypothetical protein
MTFCFAGSYRPLQIILASWSLALAVGWLVPTMPFVPVALSASAAVEQTPETVLNALWAEATLWGITVEATCNKDQSSNHDLVEDACVKAPPWGEHDFLEAATLATQTETRIFTHWHRRFEYGGERLFALHLLGHVIGLCWFLAATGQMCVAANILIYSILRTPQRRAWLIIFSFVPSFFGWTGIYFLRSSFQMNGLFFPDEVEPVVVEQAWGAMLAQVVACSSVIHTAWTMLTLDRPYYEKDDEREPLSEHLDGQDGEQGERATRKSGRRGRADDEQ